jgi:hypothetical protein
MKRTSILVKDEINHLLRVACEGAEQYGGFKTDLFVLTTDARRFWFPLPPLPARRKERAPYFLDIGTELYRNGWVPAEAVFLTAGWRVVGQKGLAAIDFAPSAGPSLEQALVAIGRSADNRRYTHVVQPFTLDKHNRLVWQAMAIADYDQPQTPGSGSTGLLDYLFEAIPKSS